MRKYTVDESVFDSIDSPEKAWALGFLLADGCISKARTRKHYKLTVAVAIRDLDVLHKLKRIMHYSGPVLVFRNFNRACNKWIDWGSLTVSSSVLTARLMRLGILPRKSQKEKFLPCITKNYEQHFIRGIVCGDGAVYRNTANKKYHYYLASIVGTRQLLSAISGRSPVSMKMYKDRRSRNHFELRAYGKRAVLFCDWLYKGSTSACRLDRKYAKYKEMKKFYNA